MLKLITTNDQKCNWSMNCGCFANYYFLNFLLFWNSWLWKWKFLNQSDCEQKNLQNSKVWNKHFMICLFLKKYSLQRVILYINNFTSQNLIQNCFTVLDFDCTSNAFRQIFLAEEQFSQSNYHSPSVLQCFANFSTIKCRASCSFMKMESIKLATVSRVWELIVSSEIFQGFFSVYSLNRAFPKCEKKTNIVRIKMFFPPRTSHQISPLKIETILDYKKTLLL